MLLSHFIGKQVEYRKLSNWALVGHAGQLGLAPRLSASEPAAKATL